MSGAPMRYEKLQEADFKVTVSYKNSLHTGTVFCSSRLLYQVSGKDRDFIRGQVLEWCNSPELIERRKHELLIKFLERHGISLEESKQRFLEATPNRINHCYECHREVTTFTNPVCKKCTWLVCDCFACGCGYYSAR
jgi:hypothetical protein